MWSLKKSLVLSVIGSDSELNIAIHLYYLIFLFIATGFPFVEQISNDENQRDDNDCEKCGNHLVSIHFLSFDSRYQIVLFRNFMSSCEYIIQNIKAAITTSSINIMYNIIILLGE